MTSQTKPFKINFFLPFNFAITKICFAIRLADDGTRMGCIYFQLSPSLDMYVSWIARDKILILKLSPSKFRYFADQNEPKRGSHENEFQNFQIQKWIQRTVRAQRADGKICLVSFFPSWIMVIKLPKIVLFLQIYADLCRKSKSVKAIYLCPSKRPDHTISENSMFYRGLSNSSQDLEE